MTSRTKLALKSSVTRRQDEGGDQLERLAQAAYHQAVENADRPAIDTAPAAESAQPASKPKRDPNALQAAFLSANLGKPVSVFLINGIRVTGRIRQFDQFTILLQASGGMDQMLFKHAVASIQSSSR